MAEHLRALVTAATVIALASAGVAGCGDGQHTTVTRARFLHSLRLVHSLGLYLV